VSFFFFAFFLSCRDRGSIFLGVDAGDCGGLQEDDGLGDVIFLVILVVLMESDVFFFLSMMVSFSFFGDNDGVVVGGGGGGSWFGFVCVLVSIVEGEGLLHCCCCCWWWCLFGSFGVYTMCLLLLFLMDEDLKALSWVALDPLSWIHELVAGNSKMS